MSKRLLSNEKGFSLIELTIVVVIIAVLMGIAVKGWGFVQSSRVTAAIEQVQTLRTAAVNWRYTSGQVDYAAVTMAALLTRDLIKSTDSANAWGGANDVAPGATSTELQVTSAGLPASHAPDVVSGLTALFGTSVTVAESGGTVTVTFPD